MLGDDVLPQPYRFVNKVVQRCVERALEEIAFHMSRSPVLDRKYIPPKLTKKINQNTTGIVITPELLERPSTVSGSSVYPPELGMAAAEAQRVYDQGQIQKKRNLRIKGIESQPTSVSTTPLPHDIGNASIRTTSAEGVDSSGGAGPALYPPRTSITASHLDAPTAIFGLSDGSVQIVNTETKSLLMRTPVLFDTITHTIKYPDTGAVAAAVLAACRVAVSGSGTVDQDRCRSPQQQPTQASPGKPGASPGRTSRNGSKRDATPPPAALAGRDSAPAIASPLSASTTANPYLPLVKGSSVQQPTPTAGAGIVSVSGGTPLHAHNLELFAAATAVDGIVVFAVDVDGLAEGPKLYKGGGPLGGSNVQLNSTVGVRDAEVKALKDVLSEGMTKKTPQQSSEGKQRAKSGSGVSGATSASARPGMAAAGTIMSSSKRSGGGAPLRDAAPPIELGVVARITHQMLSSAVTAFYDQHPSQHPLTAYYNNVQRTKTAAGSPTSAGVTAANAASGRSSAGGTEGGLTPRRQKSSNAITATNSGGASLGVQGGAKINGGSGGAALEVNMMIPTDGGEAFVKEGGSAATTRPVPPPPAAPGSFVSSIKLSADGTFLAVGMDDDATVVVVELFTTSKGDMFGRVPHVVEVIASPSQLCEAVGDMSTPRAHYHFGTLSAPFSTPSHQPQPNPVMEYLRREAKAAQTAATAALATALDGSGTLDTSTSVVPPPAGASTPRNPTANTTTIEKDRQQRLKQLSDECDAAVLSFDPLPTVSGWLFVGWAGTNSMTRVSLKNTAAVVRSVIFASIETLMKSLQPSTADVCLGLVVEETAKVIAASRVDAISQLHSKVNHQLNRAALGPSGTGALSGPAGPVAQDVSIGGAATTKKGGGGATGVDKPPRGRGGAQNTAASGSQALDGSGAISGPFPVCGDVAGVMSGSSSSIATISVAHAVAAAMGVLPPSGSALVHPISGISMIATLQQSGNPSGTRCGSSGSLVGGVSGGGGLPTPPRKDPPSPSQARSNASNVVAMTIPQNSRCDLLLPTTLITTSASRDKSLIALCCINGITAVYDTTTLNFKHYFNEMPHRVANRCQRLVAPLHATFQGNRTLTVATVTYGASYRSFVSVFALQPGLAFPPASTSRTVQEQLKRTAGRSAAVVEQEELQNSNTYNTVPTSGLLTLDSPTRSRHRLMADQQGYLSSLGKHSVHLDSSVNRSHGISDIDLSTTLLPTPENHHSSITPAAAASGVRLCRVPYLDSLEYAVPLGEHLPLMVVKACGGQMLIVDMTEGELVCILNPDSTGTSSSPAGGGISAALDAAFGASTTSVPKSKASKADATAIDTWEGSSIAAAVRSALPPGQGLCWSSASIDTTIHSYLLQIASNNDLANLDSHPHNAVPLSLSIGGGDYGTVVQSGVPTPFPTRTGTSAVYSEPITCAAVLQRPQLAQQIASAILSRSTPQAVASFKNYQGIPILSTEYPHLQRLLSNSTADQVGPLLFVMQHSTRMAPLTADRVGAAQQTVHFYQQAYFNGGVVGSEQAPHPQQSAGVISLGALMGGHGSTGGALAAASMWSGVEHLNSAHRTTLSPASTNLSRLPNRSVSKLTTGTVDTLGAAPPTPISLDEPVKSARGGRGGTIRLGGMSPPHSATAMSEPPRSATHTHRTDKHHVVVPQPIPAAETSFKQATLDSLEAQERGRAMRKQRFDATWERLKAVAPTGGEKPTRNTTAPSKQQRM